MLLSFRVDEGSQPAQNQRVVLTHALLRRLGRKEIYLQVLLWSGVRRKNLHGRGAGLDHPAAGQLDRERPDIKNSALRWNALQLRALQWINLRERQRTSQNTN